MSEMVERVARAIDPDAWARLDSGEPSGPAMLGPSIAAAKRAIEAMREPNSGEIDEAYWRESGELTRNEIKRAWQAMIDAALS